MAQPKSYLDEDTVRVMREQRLTEQAGKRAFARVYAHAHEDELSDIRPVADFSAESDAPQQDVLAHPILQNLQRLDGVDRVLLNPNAKIDLENEERKQQEEHQLRMGLSPGVNRAPRPDPFH